MATDNVGNVQPTPKAAQATTKVDTTPLASSVTTLPSFSPGSFTVSWSGTDNSGGSGIATYSIFVSDNGGAFVPLETSTTLTSTTYTGQDGHSYGFYSIATDNVGNIQPTPSSAQTITTVDTIPPTSSITALSSFGPGSFTVSWSGTDDTGGSGIATYSIYVSDNGGAFVPVVTNTATISTTFTGQNGHSYGFYSVATDGAGNVQPTPSGAQASTKVDTVDPTSTVRALPSFRNSSFTVSWSGADNTGGSGLATYSVFVSDNGGAFVPLETNTTLTSITYTGQEGHTYGFYSVATDNVGNIQPTPNAAQATTKVDTTPPTSSVTAVSSFSPGSFTVFWSGADNTGGSGIATYSVFVSDNGGAFVPLETNTTLTSTTYTGQDGHTYGFYSIATDNVGNIQPTPSSAQATTKVDTTPPTSRVTALSSFSPGSFTVFWSGADNTGGSGIATYSVFVSDDGGPYHAFVTNTSATSATFTGTDGHTYSFYSVATDNVGNIQPTPSSAQATTKVDTTPPTSGVTALSSFSPGSFTVSWSGSDNTGGSGIATYSVFVSDNGGAFVPLETDTTLTSTTYIGQEGHSYGFYSIATDTVGNIQPTPSSAQTTTTVDTIPPTSSVTALPTFTVGSFTVSWSGTDDTGGSGIATYSIFVSDNGGAFVPLVTNTATTSTTYTGQNGHRYGFYSIATDGAGNVQPTPSGAQASAKVDTVSPISTVTALPSFSNSSFTVSWSGADNTGGSGLATYSVFVSDNGGAFVPLETNTTLTSITYTGTDGHTYGFYSVATDNIGNIQPTPNAAQATTKVDTTPPTSSVTALTSFSPGSFTVSWSGTDNTGGAGIATYSVFVSDNSGAFVPLETNTTSMSTTYTGQDGHTYGFYCIATDNVGNIQPTPSSAQATTKVEATPPTSSVTALPTFSPGSFTVSWSGTDNTGGSGIATYSVFVSDNGRAFHAFVTNTSADLGHLHRHGRPYLRLLQRGHRQRRQRPAHTRRYPDDDQGRHRRAKQHGGHPARVQRGQLLGFLVGYGQHRRLGYRDLQRVRLRQRRGLCAAEDQHERDLGHLHRTGRSYLRLLQRGHRQRRQRPAHTHPSPGHHESRCHPADQHGCRPAGVQQWQLHGVLVRLRRQRRIGTGHIQRLRIRQRGNLPASGHQHDQHLDDLQRQRRPYLRLLLAGHGRCRQSPADASLGAGDDHGGHQRANPQRQPLGHPG